MGARHHNHRHHQGPLGHRADIALILPAFALAFLFSGSGKTPRRVLLLNQPESLNPLHTAPRNPGGVECNV
uniref:CPFTSY TRANSPORT, CHLOROPLAST BIOGENESIS, SIMIBI.8A n=1 Tax=Siphoviridae sp. ctpLW14 TaxID=2826464 RepID=A0A8S5N9C8_9CAUD|nr:MAG TPA: CPFTSY TRANSPORT, CHLOROPLAST BIOGENESIS, SIMIBI.8A [Siphoviridae sp. ctpLW14]